MDRIIEEYIDKIKDIDNVNEYDEIIRKLNYSLTDEYPEEFRREIEQKQKYLKNRFSDEANREKMFEAKEKVIGCLRNFLYKEKADDSRETLIKYLNNFHVFMEELTDKEPDIFLMNHTPAADKHKLPVLHPQSQKDMSSLQNFPTVPLAFFPYTASYPG